VAELKKYDPALHAKPRWLVLNKLDMVPAESARRASRTSCAAALEGPGVRDLGAGARGPASRWSRPSTKHVAAHRRRCRAEPDPRFDAPAVPAAVDMSVVLRRAAHRRQGRLQPGHQRGPRHRRRGHRQLVPPAGRAGAQGREVVMVSSGAIAEGMKRLGWSDARPKELHELQAAAAVGQMGLAQMYETKLREQGMGSARCC
jgi:hypothetical protein